LDKKIENKRIIENWDNFVNAYSLKF
jgi:hypothetical protein